MVFLFNDSIVRVDVICVRKGQSESIPCIILAEVLTINNTRLMKLYRIISVALSLMLGLVLINATNNSGGPAAGNTRAAGESSCSRVGCHASLINRPLDSATTIVFAGLTNASYVPGTTYEVTANISSATRNKFGFQLQALNSNNTKAGTIAKATASDNTVQIFNGSGTFANRTYIQHTSSGNTGTASGGRNRRTWSFKWTAPAAGTGDVTFYACFLIANGNGQEDAADSTYSTRYTLTEGSATAVDPNLAKDIRFVAYPNPTADYVNIAFDLPKAGDVNLKLINLSGATVYQQTIEATAGAQAHRIEAGNLVPGYYMLHMTVNGQTMTHKLLYQ
jgi:hypothetical protein